MAKQPTRSKVAKRSKRRTKVRTARRVAPLPPPPLDEGECGSAVEMAMDKKLRKRGYWFDPDEADRVCAFIQTYCVHSKGQWSGKPLRLEPWQRAKIRRLFGWRRPDGTRRYRRTAWWLPRKNGKSTLIAAIALYLTTADGEAGAEVYSAASGEDQARIVFDEAKRMVNSSPASRATVPP